MELTYIDGQNLKRFMINGANRLWVNRDKVDAMNVFPVPDGDTGTNMSATMTAVANAIKDIDSTDISEVAKIVSGSALRGARGNSGVILSQILRGFYKELNGKDKIDASELARCFAAAADTAYKAVMKPKEGTMLTIIREMGAKAVETGYTTDDIPELLKAILSHGREVLAKTPDMLPQLKNAGVVDSGGQGLLYIIEGGYEYIGSIAEVASLDSADTVKSITAPIEANADIKFGYCTEFFVNIQDNKTDFEDGFRSYLDSMGDSIVMVCDEDIIKVHIHTNHPGEVLEKALEIGPLENMKIENMCLQHTSLIKEAETKATKRYENTDIPEKGESKKLSVVAVSNGEGFGSMLLQLGVDTVLANDNGSMRCGTDHFINTIEAAQGSTVILFPNDKDNIMAAKQAAEICKEKNVVVIDTKSVPECLEAMVMFDEDSDIRTLERDMREAAGSVDVAKVTKAVKNTVVDSIEIKEGDYIGILNDKIVLKTDNCRKASDMLVEKMLDNNEDACVLSIYKGSEGSEKEAEDIESYALKLNSELDICVEQGGQSTYNYIITVS